MPEKRRIAVFANALHDRRPRGVQRVARAVTEELLEILPPDTEFCCLIAKVGRQHELTYQCCDLRGWLACNPLITDEHPGAPGVYIVRNTIGRNLHCSGLTPGVSGGFVPGSVNVVGRHATGQCAALV